MSYSTLGGLTASQADGDYELFISTLLASTFDETALPAADEGEFYTFRDDATITLDGTAYDVQRGDRLRCIADNTLAGAGGGWEVISMSPENEGGIPGNIVNATSAAQSVSLPDSMVENGEAYKVIDDTNGVSFTTATGEPLIGDVDHLEEGAALISIPSQVKVPGALVLIADQADNAPNTVDWVVSPNVTLRRGSTGGLYNVAAGQASWSGGNATGTLWRNDTVTTPTGFQSSYGGAIGDEILTPEYDNVYVTDTVTGTEYGPFTFTRWQDGGGGGFAVSDQTTTPDLFQPAQELIDPRPEVRVANELRNISPVLEGLVETGATTGAPAGISLNGRVGVTAPVGGQRNVQGPSTHDFDPVRMDRLEVTSWNDSANSCSMTFTIREQGGGTQTVPFSTSNPGGSSPVTNTATVTFTEAVVVGIDVTIDSGTFRAGRVVPQFGATVAGTAGNTFNTALYQGAHDHLTIVNPDPDRSLLVAGLDGGNITLESGLMLSISRVDGVWYAEAQEEPANYIRTIQNGAYDLSSANTNNATLVSVLADGSVTVTHGDGTLGGFNAATTVLADGEVQLFTLSSILGWLPVGNSNNSLVFIEKRCYEEGGAAFDLNGLLPYLDEINSTQLATVPAGAHMRWTATQDVVLNTLEVARLGSPTTTTISWTTSNGDSGSDTFAHGGADNANTPINLGGVALTAGDTIDFTLDDITGGQMQLNTAATSIAQGWTALQDYSGFATTSTWSTRLIGTDPIISHDVNVYDVGGAEVYQELSGGALNPIAAIPATWNLVDCLDATDVNRERWEVTERNTGGQPGGDGLFPFQSDKLNQTHHSRLVEYNGDGTWTVKTELYPVKVVLNAHTIGATGTAQRVSYIKETGAAAGTRLPNSTDGVFGGFVPDEQATVIIPADTTITIEGRSVSSGNNQALETGASMEFIELIEPTDQRSIIANAAGSVRLSRHDEIVNLTATIVTGHDLTQASNMTLKVFIRDSANDRGWQTIDLDVDNIMETEAASTNDGFGLLFDNDFINVNIVDAATGEITFTQNGRDFEYVWSELWLTAPTTDGMQEVSNASIVTTGAFQNLGDPNELYAGADGDRVHLEYADGNRSPFTFLDGSIKEERKGFEGQDTEIQLIASGQLQIRDVAGVSTVVRAWYEWKDGVVRTTKSVQSSDCTIEIEDLGSAQDVRLDPIGVLHYLHNRRDIELTYAKEGTSGHGITVSKFDAETRTLTPVTYDNLQNTTDSGGGALAVSGGANSNFNRRAKTVDAINKVGDYFEFTVNAFTNTFATARLAFAAASDTRNAEAITDEYRLEFATQGATYTLFDPSGVAVATGTRGTFRLMRTYYGIKLSVDGTTVYESPRVDIDHISQPAQTDTIPLFTGGAAAKTDFLTLPDGRPYTVVTDDAGITEVLERNYDGEKYRFIEIEVVKDPSAVAGFYLRPNTPGSGRQSQMRGSVVAPATFVANSGANTSLPVVIRELETEYTIRYLVQFTEPATFGHTEVEIAPTGANLDLTIDASTPPLQGSIGVVSVTLYGADPS